MRTEEPTTLDAGCAGCESCCLELAPRGKLPPRGGSGAGIDSSSVGAGAARCDTAATVVGTDAVAVDDEADEEDDTADGRPEDDAAADVVGGEGRAAAAGGESTARLAMTVRTVGVRTAAALELVDVDVDVDRAVGCLEDGAKVDVDVDVDADADGDVAARPGVIETVAWSVGEKASSARGRTSWRVRIEPPRVAEAVGARAVRDWPEPARDGGERSCCLRVRQ
jgi:hypothetical protein